MACANDGPLFNRILPFANLLRDDDFGRRMGKRAREVAVERFDEAKIVPLYREMYERVSS